MCMCVCVCVGHETSIERALHGHHIRHLNETSKRRKYRYVVKLDGLVAELRSTCHYDAISDIAYPAEYSEVFFFVKESVDRRALDR